MKVEVEVPDCLCSRRAVFGAVCFIVVFIWLVTSSPESHVQKINSTTTRRDKSAASTVNTQKLASTPSSELHPHNHPNAPLLPPQQLQVLRPSILCMVFTTPFQWEIRGLAVKLTWGKRCNYYAFFYSKVNGTQLKGAYALDVPEGRDHLTAKSMTAFQISYQQYGDKVDWYLKADDDTYFIMENLRALLSQYDPVKPVYLGHTSNDFLRQGYNSGGAGYVLSKEAVRLVVTKGDEFPKNCPLDGGIEDLDMGRCLEAFRVFPTETRDSQSRITFHPDHPMKLLNGDPDALSVYTYTKRNYTFGNYQGIRVLSPFAVSFHYMDIGHMYMYDFLLYELLRDYEKVT